MPLTLDDLKNFTLDSIITRNRDKVSIGLANDEELQQLATTSLVDVELKETLDNWHLVSYRLLGYESKIIMLGTVRSSRLTRITSMVQQVDTQHGVVRTMNSLYGLGTTGDAKMPIDQMFLMVRSLREAGLQNALGLPEVTLE